MFKQMDKKIIAILRSKFLLTWPYKDFIKFSFLFIKLRECSGSVVESLTGDRGAAGSSLTSVAAL